MGSFFVDVREAYTGTIFQTAATDYPDIRMEWWQKEESFSPSTCNETVSLDI
jgi:hypothetical protein